MPARESRVRAEDRLSIRASRAQKQVLRRAAEARHLNVSQFVLQASLDEAERILEAESTVVLSPEDYAWLVKAMSEPARDLPRLREALARPSVWEP